MRNLLQVRLLVMLSVLIGKLYGASWAEEFSLANAAYDAGDYGSAEKHDRAALTAAEAFGESDDRLERTLTHLVAAVQARGACCDAEPLARRALAIKEVKFGKTSLEAAIGKNNLASVWQQAGRAKEAQQMQAEALAVAEANLPPGSTQLIPFLTLAALTERDAAHYDKALGLLKRARILAESEATPNPRYIMQITRYVASVNRSADRFDDAESAYKQLIMLSESRYGSDSLDTMTSVANLGSLLCDHQLYREALPYLTRAASTFQRTGETNLPSYAATLQNMARAELTLGQARSAEQHALLAVHILEDQKVIDAQSLAVAENNLGQVYVTEGRYSESEGAMEQALKIWLETTGHDSAKTAATISNLGALYVRMHKYKKAEAFYAEATEIDRKILGEISLAYAETSTGWVYLTMSESIFRKRKPHCEQLWKLNRESWSLAARCWPRRISTLGFRYKGNTGMTKR